MTRKSEVNKAKRKLIRKAIRKEGVWENFGDKEYMNLKDKFGNTKEIDEFFQWMINFDDRDLQREKQKLKKVI